LGGELDTATVLRVFLKLADLRLANVVTIFGETIGREFDRRMNA
jgi:hypothetical protein